MPDKDGLLGDHIRAGMERATAPAKTPERGAPTIKQVIKRNKTGRTRRALWEGQWIDAFDFTMPNRNLLKNQSRGARKIPPTLFDSTAIKSVQRFAGRLQSALIPSFREWITFEAGIDVPRNERHDINMRLEEQQEIFFEQIDASNLPQSLNESFLDLSIGTGALILRDEGADHPINYISVPMSEYTIEEGPFGSVETQFRQWKLPMRNALRLWPNHQMTSDMLDEGVDMDKDVEVIEAVMFDFAAGVYWKSAVMIKPRELWLQEPITSPDSGWAVFRWSKTSGEIWGRGPTLDLLPTIKTLNKVAEFTLRNAHLAIAGTYVADDQGVLNPMNFVLKAGAVNIMRNIDRIKAMESAHDFNVSSLIAGDLKTDIREGLFVDRLPDAEGAVRSPTELMLRNKELMEDIGSSFGRLQAELVLRIVQQTVAILVRQGKMADFRPDGREVMVRYTGPLSRAQDLEELQNMRAYLEIVGGLGPEILLLGTALEDVPEFIAQKLGVPVRLVRSAAQRGELQKLAIEQAQAAQGGQPRGQLEPPIEDAELQEAA